MGTAAIQQTGDRKNIEGHIRAHQAISHQKSHRSLHRSGVGQIVTTVIIHVSDLTIFDIQIAGTPNRLARSKFGMTSKILGRRQIDVEAAFGAQGESIRPIGKRHIFTANPLV